MSDDNFAELFDDVWTELVKKGDADEADRETAKGYFFMGASVVLTVQRQIGKMARGDKGAAFAALRRLEGEISAHITAQYAIAEAREAAQKKGDNGNG